jgi:hypothetical protein
VAVTVDRTQETAGVAALAAVLVSKTTKELVLLDKVMTVELLVEVPVEMMLAVVAVLVQ